MPLNREDDKYISDLEQKCRENLMADPNELNRLRAMITQFRVSELTVSYNFFQNFSEFFKNFSEFYKKFSEFFKIFFDWSLILVNQRPPVRPIAHINRVSEIFLVNYRRG